MTAKWLTKITIQGTRNSPLPLAGEGSLAGSQLWINLGFKGTGLAILSIFFL
jgi:hypothetical protein